MIVEEEVKVMSLICVLQCVAVCCSVLQCVAVCCMIVEEEVKVMSLI